MLHPHDQMSIVRMLGSEEIPPALIEEYDIRLSMFHRDGGSGPLRAAMLIDLLRSMDLSPPNKVWEPPVHIDWRALATDGSVRVDAKFSDEWKHGDFLGLVGSGTMAIKFDDDSTVRECPQHEVRLVEPEESFEDDMLNDPVKWVEPLDEATETPETPVVKKKVTKKATKKTKVSRPES